MMDRQTHAVKDMAALADWRRRVSETYAGIRAVPNHGAQAWTGWRAVRDDLFKSHAASPLSSDQQATFKELAYFDYDPAFRFLVGISDAVDFTPQTIALMDDGPLTLTPAFETIGLAEKLGRELTVHWIDGYCGGLFLAFNDATNGSETYGEGRYLLDGIKGVDLGQIEDGRLVLDFNFAYNPCCAYAPRWSCPLPLEVNRLSSKILAGEKIVQKTA